MGATPLNDELASIAETNGIDRIGFCTAEVFEEVRRTLHTRKAEGLSADMQFTYRNPDRSTDPSRAVAGARSIVVAAKSYRRAPRPDSATTVGSAEIAQYVWEPYYRELGVVLDQIADHLKSLGWKARVLVDDNALVDRAAAYRAGIGWWGKNSNILIPGVGSRFVIGSVVTDASLVPNSEPLGDQCGSCRRCIDVCPTDAIVADGVIDSNRCLAWLVQSDGVFPREHRRALGGRIYGCDDCQTSCPPNVISDRADAPAMTTGSSSAPVEELLTLDDAALMERFGAWYIPRREPRYLRRNALVVLANIGDPAQPGVRKLIERYVRSTDEIERTHAIWAANELDYGDLIPDVGAESSQMVRDELLAMGRRPQ